MPSSSQLRRVVRCLVLPRIRDNSHGNVHHSYRGDSRGFSRCPLSFLARSMSTPAAAWCCVARYTRNTEHSPILCNETQLNSWKIFDVYGVPGGHSFCVLHCMYKEGYCHIVTCYCCVKMEDTVMARVFTWNIAVRKPTFTLYLQIDPLSLKSTV